MLGLLAALAAQVASPPPKTWPTHEQDLVLKDFRFRDGETLPSLRMHVTTLGQPHRNAGGQIDNAIMVLTAQAGPASNSCSLNSPTSCTGRVSRSTSAAISSSCRTTSVMAARPSRQTECACISPNMITPT